MSQPNEDTRAGLAFAVSAYVLWGALPIYMTWLAHVGPVEIVAHRVLWSIPVAALVLVALRRTGDVLHALRTPRMLAMGGVTAVLVSSNWAIYVWAVTNNQALDAALGYYINPLFSVALGGLVLREKLSAVQLSAVGLAGLAVAVLTWFNGALPLAALCMTLTWGLYAYFKKQLPIGPNQGFMLEVLILAPFALGYLIWLGPQNGFRADPWLFAGLGAVTAIPLILYANGAKGLRLSTIGILQYIAPTLIFLTAVFLFGEPFGTAERIAFPMIWAALVMYSWAMWRQMRKPPGW